MNFFDDLISEFQSSIEAYTCNNIPYNSSKLWEDVGCNELVMQRETLCELDGTGFNLVTSNNIGASEIDIIGDDMKNITCDRKFARISIIQIDDVADEQKAYDLIRKIEYVKYHYFPKGYMIRTSSRSHKEVVRVSKSAVAGGISFEKVGNLLINKYKEIPFVKNVKVFFVTDKSFDYKYMDSLAQKNHSITETLNHVMNSVNFDCSTCNMKPICDEVEGMKELHFKTAMK
jgi:CO dehydrogenase/acetyl-CoA synthase beta subunit